MIEPRFSQASGHSKAIRLLAIVALASLGYYLCARLGYAFIVRPAGIAVLWPASGFMLAVLALLPRRDWLPAVAGGILGNIAADVANGASMPMALAGSAANGLESVAASWVLVRLAGTPVTLTAPRQVAALICAAVASNGLTALVGAFVLGGTSPMAFWKGWFAWWTGDGIGMLVVAPVILTWAGWRGVGRLRLGWRTVEGVLSFAALITLAHLVLRDKPDPGLALSADPYVVLPLLFWAAFRFGSRGASIATLSLAAVALWSAARGLGPFSQSGLSPTNQVLQLYVYLAFASLSSLLAAALLGARQVAEAAVLERANLATFVADVATALTTSGQLRHVLGHCTKAMAHQLGAARARIWTLNSLEHVLELQASSGETFPDDEAEIRVPIGTGTIGHIAQDGRPLVSDHVSDDRRFHDQPWMKRERLVSFVGYPLAVNDQVVGVLAIFARERLSNRTLDSLASVADTIALGIERHRLEESRAQLAGILDAASDFVTIGRPTGRPAYINHAARMALGIGETETVDSLLAFRQAGFREFFETTVLPTAIRDGRWSGETAYVSRSGRIIPVSQVSVVHRDARGEVAFLSTISRDISERQRAEAQLRLLARAVESTDEMVSVIDLQGRFTFVNPAFLRTYGYAIDEVLGQPPALLRATNASDEKTREILEATLRGGWTGEVKHRRKDGRELLIYLHTSPIRDDEGQVIALLGGAQDISERRSLEDRLRQSQKLEAVGQLAGGIAHDFNNLLTAILGYSEILAESLPADDERRNDVNEISGAAKRAAGLTRQLLAFSRKQILTMQVLRVGRVVNDVMPMLRRVLGENIDLKVVIADEGAVKADTGQLEQVLVNLAVNARDAMPDGGRLTIETADVRLDEAYAQQRAGVQPGAHVVLAVSDTGHGMDHATQQRIFEPFFTTKPQGKGTGLGLATVHGIVTQCGGHVGVYSEVDRGTTFRVYLPRTDDAAAVVKPKTEARSLRGSERILLVEDEELVRVFVGRVLRRYGYTVHAASDSASALEFARAHDAPIHAVLTDVVLPGMNGRDLATRLLEHHPGARVLYMSGYTDTAIVHHGVLDEDTWFLQKPFSAEALARKVRDLLDA